MSWSSRKKKEFIFLTFIFPKKIRGALSTCVLNKLSEYLYFYSSTYQQSKVLHFLPSFYNHILETFNFWIFQRKIEIKVFRKCDIAATTLEKENGFLIFYDFLWW